MKNESFKYIAINDTFSHAHPFTIFSELPSSGRISFNEKKTFTFGPISSQHELKYKGFSIA
jgi:hypothetical protein